MLVVPKLVPKISNMFQVAGLILSFGLILSTSLNHQPLQSAVGFSILGYIVSNYLIPRAAPVFIRKGLSGKDLSKVGNPVLAEAIGVIPAITYLFLMFLFIPFLFFKFLITETSGGGSRDSGHTVLEDVGSLFPHNKLASYLSSILCLESVILLGLMDDLFDLRWRHKFLIPAVGAIPLLIVYYIDFGVTWILVPKFVRQLTGWEQTSIDLGWLYYGYMGALIIFCPNSVNILAGVNGLEVGQTVVLGVLVLLNDLCYLVSPDSPAFETHLYSACMLIPFLGVALSLLKWNWFPAKVFVGDTFCYFSGMVFAVVGISSHFSKTLLLFFSMQIVNFVYSSPQLFGLVFCPRHRLPKFNSEDGKLYPSRANFKEKPLKKWVAAAMLLLERFKLVQLTKKDGIIEESSNLTIINLFLVWFGPMREDQLCSALLFTQFAVGLVCLVLRHTLASLLFGYDNLFLKFVS
ncbi:unnamed protein product [Kuraishia capsulata CBS 1993]|uniref:UDP-N-acetylglucosamine--dolichyl-phosphate N-acetylglucosaminephosphotransferase n=1 Tax=Kuraishia capsulata CBS 1993 TaxID=1382522 RepID=W6MR06_9ASCO|nr:uncharacterized protein KUCA_T00000265001 [Kuraishia capsulata CBS 1993]CDK24305.1 unnamed protein product [Kuraishia capsulata CBS 1993]